MFLFKSQAEAIGNYAKIVIMTKKKKKVLINYIKMLEMHQSKKYNYYNSKIIREVVYLHRG